MKRLISFLVIILSITLFQHCATRGAPAGGPADKTPPTVVYTSPAADSTGISSLNEIKIIFSERMDEPSVQKDLFISPPLKFEQEWSGGDELILSLADSLVKDRTYVLTIGSQAKDAHSNRFEKSFQFAFSSGDKIDQGQISGSVFGINSKDLLYVFAYKGAPGDTLLPFNKDPDFVTQANSEGQYELSFMAMGYYRLFVVEDQNRNLELDADYERVGIPYRDVELDSITPSLQSLNFVVSRADTTAPYASGLRSINERKALLRISEPVVSLSTENITLRDSVSNELIPLLGITQNPEESKQYYLYTHSLDSGTVYRCNINGLIDTSANKQADTSGFSFLPKMEKDTTHFKLLGVSPADSIKNIRLDATITLEFSIPVDTLSILKAVNILDSDSNKVSGNWQEIGLTLFNFKPETNWLPGGNYVYSVNFNPIRSLWGDSLPDSLIVNRFFPVSAEEFGSVSGEVHFSDAHDFSARIRFYPVQRGGSTHETEIDADGSFKIDLMPEGKYTLGGFADLNADGKLSTGRLFPLRFAEPLFVAPDTIRVRKRWEVSGVTFQFPKVR